MEKSLLHRTPAGTNWMRYHFLTKKMSTPVGLAVMLLITLAMTYLTVLVDYKISIGIVAVVGIVLLGIAGVVFPAFGFYFTIFISMFTAMPERILNSSDRKSTRLNSSHGYISYAVFCLKKKKK